MIRLESFFLVYFRRWIRKLGDRLDRSNFICLLVYLKRARSGN